MAAVLCLASKEHLVGKYIVEGLELHKTYHLGDREVKALRGVSFKFALGEFAALVGTSGSGKTTALNMIGCLDYPTSGRILINGVDMSGVDDESLASFRAHTLGFIFQTFNLIPVLSAVENVEYPLVHQNLSKSERRTRALETLHQVGLSDHADHRPNQLSGGQRQRVAIARALVHRPQLVVADEPTANLDRKNASEIVELIRKMNRDLGVTCIFTSHDPAVYEKADRIIHLVDGEIVA